MQPVIVGMCDRCSTVPWDQLANGSPDQELFVLAETAEQLQTSTCRICRLLGAVLFMDGVRSVSPRLKWQADRFRSGNRIGNILFCYNEQSGNESSSQALTATVDRPADIE